MNISDFVRSNAATSYLNRSVSTQSSNSVNLSGLDDAKKRIQSQQDSTTTELSSIGKLKSAISDTQSTAKTLSGFSEKSSFTSVKTGADAFVKSFNSTIGLAKTTANVQTQTSSSQSAARAGKDMGASLDSKTTESLNKIGITVQGDGTLAIDGKKFAEAQKSDSANVNSTLSDFGKKVDKTAANELASSGSVGKSMSVLNQRSSDLNIQQNTLSAIQQSANAAFTGSSFLSNLGISTYRNFV